MCVVCMQHNGGNSLYLNNIFFFGEDPTIYLLSIYTDMVYARVHRHERAKIAAMFSPLLLFAAFFHVRRLILILSSYIFTNTHMRSEWLCDRCLSACLYLAVGTKTVAEQNIAFFPVHFQINYPIFVFCFIREYFFFHGHRPSR